MNIYQRQHYEAHFNLLGHTLCNYFEQLKEEDPKRKQLGEMMRCLTEMYTFTNTILIDNMYLNKRLQKSINDYNKKVQQLTKKINEQDYVIRFHEMEPSRFANKNGK